MLMSLPFEKRTGVIVELLLQVSALGLEDSMDIPGGEPTEKALATGKPQVTSLFVGSMTKQLTYGIIVPVEKE